MYVPCLNFKTLHFTPYCGGRHGPVRISLLLYIFILHLHLSFPLLSFNPSLSCLLSLFQLSFYKCCCFKAMIYPRCTSELHSSYVTLPAGLSFACGYYTSWRGLWPIRGRQEFEGASTVVTPMSGLVWGMSSFR